MDTTRGRKKKGRKEGEGEGRKGREKERELLFSMVGIKGYTKEGEGDCGCKERGKEKEKGGR
jgi:hypothetical protein